MQNILNNSQPTPDGVINDAISRVGTTRANLSLSIEKHLKGSRYRLPDIEKTFNNPFGMEKYARDLCAGYNAGDNSLKAVLENASRQHKMWFKDLHKDFKITDAPIERSVRLLYEAGNQQPPENIDDKIKNQLGPLPDEIKSGISILISAGSSELVKSGISLTVDCDGSDLYITRRNYARVPVFSASVCWWIFPATTIITTKTHGWNSDRGHHSSVSVCSGMTAAMTISTPTHSARAPRISESGYW
ncbi:MAG: hypothetical protein AB1599_09005 [Planctomycetota bacterium]